MTDDFWFDTYLYRLQRLAADQAVPRPYGWTDDEKLAFVIMNPEYVNPRWHQRVAVGPDLRREISDYLTAHAPQKVNHPDGAVVICPAQ